MCINTHTGTYVWSHLYFKDTYCECVYVYWGELEGERERDVIVCQVLGK